MCGIAGIVGKQEPSWLSRMNTLQTHRGPDSSGEYRDRETEVSLAMRRLAILDLAGGEQPMTNEDNSLWIVCNGEIYNAPELRPRLEAKGHHFKTASSDTEVLLHFYEDKGEEMLHDLNGMFAFVIYDKRRRTLFGARDRLGIKPFYYMELPELFAFGSELKSFLTLPFFRREIEPTSLFHFMSLLYLPGESSIFRNVKRLPAGHLFRYSIDSQKLTIRPYWDLNVLQTEDRSEDEWCELIQLNLRNALKRWMLSDVPVGFSLSGGIDSSALVGLAAQMGCRKIKTYSLGFAKPEEQEWSELPLSRLVAERYRTDHHELFLDEDVLLRDLTSMVWSLDEPYAGGLPSWYIYEFMSKEVTVGITGTGGDELFGNYGKFRCYENNPFTAIETAWNRLVNRPLVSRYFHSWYYMTDEIKRKFIFLGNHRKVTNTQDLLQQIYSRSGANNIRDGIAYMDVKTQLVDEFLLMTDRFSMAHSLEARVPYLDHQFVELIFRIPSGIRTRGSDPKYLLKKAVSDLLPAEVLQGPKRGFVIPNSLWLRGRLRPLVEQLLAPERLVQQGILRPDFFHHFVVPHLEGKRDYTWKVWPALMFQLWHLVFIETKSIQAPSFSLQDL